MAGDGEAITPATAEYRGRFAPSPTGPLHFGSLVAAVASYLDACFHGGKWLVRMEDLDRHRVVPGAADSILHTLEAFGFTWDEEVLRQSRREEQYRSELERLMASGLAFPCACTRKEILELGTVAEDGSPRYPGTCRTGIPEGREARSWRLRTHDEPILFADRCQGTVHSQVESEVGDFILQRADGITSYQLAVVVDDAAQGITDVVRGVDLLPSTARQILLQHNLGYGTPRYLHFPVAAGSNGEKLSKQTMAPALEAVNASVELTRALRFLGQSPPAELRGSPVGVVWEWARECYRPERIPVGKSFPVPA